MEAVPKLPLISFELKVSPETTHFGPKLKQYIAEVYREDPDSYGNEIHQLESLRSTAVRPTIDSPGLSALIRYFCQLRAMQSRFPMAKGQPAACTFAWKDLYANMTCSLSGVKFEMACILYNIGAMHTQLGSSEPRTTGDSLKSACQHYQYAAWAFQHLREQYPQPPGADISSDILKFLQEICFAQAQECILDKSIQDTRKSNVVGAVATQVLYFYKNSLALLGQSTGTDNIHEIIGTKLYNYWHRYLSFKSFYIGCIVCLYQGIHAEEQQKMGERVAFYQQAVDKLAEARKLAKYIEPVQVTQEALTFTNDVVEGKRKAAKNENEFIYHEEVPEKDMLSDLKPVCLVNAVPINFNDPEVAGQDIFSRLVPMGAHEASSMYSEEKAKLLRHVVAQTDTKNTELTEFMSSLQLDQLDVVDSDQKIPQEIVDRCAAMNAKTEIIQQLVDSMNSLAEIISDVEHSLNEIKTLIQDETLKEKEYQKQMGPRPPSIVQTEISREYHKYQEAHTRTNESNQVLHKAMTLHIANLRLLSQPLDVLQSKIPSIDNIEGLDRETMSEMRRVVSKAREMQTQRDSLLQQLRTALADDDVTAQLLASQDPPDEIFKREIDKHTPTVKIIEQNLAAQENIINKLTSLYASYGDSRRLLSDVLRKREGLINALVTSYDTHAELLGKSQKGLEFYRKLAHNVSGLLARLKSVCQVQREERAQLVAAHSPSTPVTSASVKNIDTPPIPSSGGTLKLKDYLPYMKNRGLARNAIPQPAQMEPLSNESYYPETIYPTSIRPTPVGSEDIHVSVATEVPQPNLPDGVVMPQSMQNMQNPYARYSTPYAPQENEPYAAPTSYQYSMNKFSKPEENYSYTSYTPSQYSSQIPDQTYTNPYYSATNNNATLVTDSQNPNMFNLGNMNQNPNQCGYTDPNTGQVYGQMPSTPDASMQYNQTDFNAGFAQMQISGQKVEQPISYGGEYSKTHYSVQYPQSFTSNMPTYSHAGQNSNTSIVQSQLPADGNVNYTYDPMTHYGQAMSNMPNTSQTPNIPSAAASPAPNQNFGPATSMQNFANPVQNGANPMQNLGNSVQNVSNPMQSVSNVLPNMGTPIHNPVNAMQNMNNPMQSVANTVQNFGASGQNIANSTPSAGNAIQNVNNPMQNITSSMQNNVNPLQNVPYQTQNFANSMQNFNNPMQHIPNSMQNVPSSIPNSSAVMTSVSAFNPETPYGYSSAYETISQGYVYTNAGSPMTSTTNVTAFSIGQTYSNPTDSVSYIDPNLSQIDAMDKPIKSHVTGQAITSTIPSYQNYNPAVNYVLDQTYRAPTQYTDSMNTSHGPNYQNHPGYVYNSATGNYEYNYGSQNSFTNYGQSTADPQEHTKESNWNVPGVYTSAGVCQTVQSPSENPQDVPPQAGNTQNYYNPPYGYLTTTNQANEFVSQPVTQSYASEITTNYGANMNNSTYIQSGQPQYTSVSYANNQVSTAKENVTEHSNNPTPVEHTNQQTPVESTPKEVDEPKPSSVKVEELKTEPTSFDLLSGLDFSVEQTPLKPEIKVPQISEKAIFKPSIVPKQKPVDIAVPKEEIIDRPPKRDLFSDPIFLNQFTQEVKNLQKLTDTFTNKTSNGLTVLDAKWKHLQEIQSKENARRSKSVASRYCPSTSTSVVPYDDSRLTLKSDSDAYINATYYKQLASWCIPLVISKCPKENEHTTFWKAMLENKISCIVCLLSEIEMQGNAYWPTAKGQSIDLADGLKVTLEDVICNVHWSERHLTVSSGKNVSRVKHYQINVYPAKIVCTPLVLLADRVLSESYTGRESDQLRGACVLDAAGAGRCSVLALLVMVMCQLRAGHVQLCDMLEEGCAKLYENRTNVLEDTKYLADAYRTVLFYVQGVLCSGTTMFNGEAVTTTTGASFLPPVPAVPPSPSPSTASLTSAKTKFSRESFEEMKQLPGLKSGDMKDPLNFLDPLWSLKKK
ncbi:tyrosine-protein phosphatase non-receptor type 23 isoform X1 [Danaus plexippus]|uniref:tyrosine-protein phosphatase non-receptor type 23 isoform X1 n=1 Tax=Danaus plexippus TaxID=13037 RepID=UPI002AB30CE4|nr:tyrosine-protein phosphatase non-receptor type 23 isoform X1 [Danaus plexippus]